MKSDAPVGPPDRGKAEATVTELGHLASGVGHHVINAFSAVVSNAEILRIRMGLADPPDPIALADAIIRTALEASAVARRLIDVTRPLTNIGTGEISLDALVADYVAVHSAKADPAVLWSATTTPVPPIIGHGEQIRALLDHLTTNSIESARAEGVEVHLATSVDNRGWVVLEVRDTARGMTPEVLERAVEPFFSTKAGHLGVGLSIANGIWRRHRGTLSVRSQPGDGTTIRLCVEPARSRQLPAAAFVPIS
jgi:two-component system, NtrC family, sensor kinase